METLEDLNQQFIEHAQNAGLQAKLSHKKIEIKKPNKYVRSGMNEIVSNLTRNYEDLVCFDIRTLKGSGVGSEVFLLVSNYWIQYAKMNGFKKVNCRIPNYESNENGGWGTKPYQTIAVECGFNQCGEELKGNTLELIYEIETSHFINVTSIYYQTIEMMENLKKDNPLIRLSNFGVNKGYCDAYLNWDGFNGIVWFTVMDKDNFKMHCVQHKAKETKGNVSIRSRKFTKDTLQEEFLNMLQEIEENMMMINAIEPPCDMLGHLINANCNDGSKIDKTTIMRMFLDKGFSYKEVETECALLLNRENVTYMNPFAIFRFDVIMKVLNNYLIIVERKNGIFEYGLASTIEEVKQFYSEMVNKNIDEDMGKVK